MAFAAGLLNIAAGVATLWSSRPLRKASDAQVGEQAVVESNGESVASSHARRAFRRRLAFGMERMDSAELVALSLELGLRLDARARLAALALLDPHETGQIDESAFVAWWEQQQQQQRA